MLKSLDSLIKEIESNTQTEKGKRKEYIETITSILNYFQRIDNNKLKKQLSFYYVDDVERNKKICFSYVVVQRKNIKGGWKEDNFDKSNIEKFKNNFDFCINHLINNDLIENFIEYLSEKAIPLFLQDQSIPDYYII